tara:strand:+ start:204 stop:2096 length:1893 start_codon:yes stop_codon:yes gene_type:complete
MRINEINAPVQPDTYEASMFIKQAIRAGKYAIKIHNILNNDQEMESWVAKKIDLASGYISSIGHYIEGQTVTEISKMPKGTGTMQGVKEDAGEGHMSKSQLYATAKYALQIASMVQPGDDIEGWMQTKMNRAVDMLDAVYHYEDYQKLNPYREQLGDLHQRHAGIVQKNIDQILATETTIDDIETIPGMLNIMKRKVQEVEKKYAKEVKETNEASIKPYVSMYKGKDGKMVYDVLDKDGNSAHKSSDQRVAQAYLKTNYDRLKEGSRMPSSMIKAKERLDAMSPDEINAFFQKRAEFFKKPARELARSQELRYGKEVAAKAPYSRHVSEDRMPSTMIKTKEKLDAMSPDEINHFFQKRAHFFGKPARELARSQELRYGKEVAAKAPYSRHVSEEILDEDFKGWLQKMAAAGIIVGSLAGIGAVNQAIDNSVPAIQAMNQALDSAEQRGDTELVAMIQKDLKGAKLRLDIGKDLNQVKYLQDKYKNFMPAGYKSEDKDDQNYPPHLQDLFKKLRDKQAQNKQVDAKVTDATPKGYGPKDDDAVNEYSPFKNKVLSKIAKPASDYAEKLKTLDMLARDPNTNRDPELQKELIRRKQQLITTKESSTVLYTNRLTDMMGKRLGESWANKFKTT